MGGLEADRRLGAAELPHDRVVPGVVAAAPHRLDRAGLEPPVRRRVGGLEGRAEGRLRGQVAAGLDGAAAKLERGAGRGQLEQGGPDALGQRRPHLVEREPQREAAEAVDRGRADRLVDVLLGGLDEQVGRAAAVVLPEPLDREGADLGVGVADQAAEQVVVVELDVVLGQVDQRAQRATALADREVVPGRHEVVELLAAQAAQLGERRVGKLSLVSHCSSIVGSGVNPAGQIAPTTCSTRAGRRAAGTPSRRRCAPARSGRAAAGTARPSGGADAAWPDRPTRSAVPSAVPVRVRTSTNTSVLPCLRDEVELAEAGPPVGRDQPVAAPDQVLGRDLLAASAGRPPRVRRRGSRQPAGRATAAGWP